MFQKCDISALLNYSNHILSFISVTVLKDLSKASPGTKDFLLESKLFLTLQKIKQNTTVICLVANPFRIPTITESRWHSR